MFFVFFKIWNKIINYNSILSSDVHFGSDIVSSNNNKLGNILHYKRKNNYIFNVDRIILNMIINKNIICKVTRNKGNFLFLTSKLDYVDILKLQAFNCKEFGMKWEPASLGNPEIRFKSYFRMNYDKLGFLISKGYSGSKLFSIFIDFVVLFDNSKFCIKHLLGEVERLTLPVLSIFDTDSFLSDNMYTMFGNDDSAKSIYFYSFFVSTCIQSVKKKI
jgi:ribosomal protein S2